MEIKNIKTCDLIHAENNPFQVKMDSEMERLIESVSKYGVITPIIVKPAENGKYEIVSGHRRKFACEYLNIDTIPAIVRELDKNQASILLVDSNLHRENLLPSEKAFAYKMKLDAIRKSPGRPKNNLRQLGTNFEKRTEVLDVAIQKAPNRCQNGTELNDEAPKKCHFGTFSRSDEQIAQSVDDSARQIQRYIRLTHLIPLLLDLVDKARIALTPAVELSYLSAEAQDYLYKQIELTDSTPSYSQAVKMRKLFTNNQLTTADIQTIMSQPKANQKEYLRLSNEKYDKYLGKYSSAREKEAFVEKALEHYAKYLERLKERDER